MFLLTANEARFLSESVMEDPSPDPVAGYIDVVHNVIREDALNGRSMSSLASPRLSAKDGNRLVKIIEDAGYNVSMDYDYLVVVW